MDLEAIEHGLRAQGGRPAIIACTAGEPMAGDFDPIAKLADLAERYGAWLHVDGAFGLFARLSSRTRALVEGVERAHSITVDGHKWLNVPYDCGFALNRDQITMAKNFAYAATYLARPDENRPVPGAYGPESSRRARSFTVWSTLRAYGREGYRHVVETNLDLARLLAERVDEAPELERLANVPLNVVCFRYRPSGCGPEELDALNERLSDALIRDGRFFVGSGRYAGRVALRPAISSWRTRAEDVEQLVSVVRSLAAALR
jgi:glutamate/tyrosine decarboxylase-like PLP-dependent enzyme